jgi:hypothetical protein
MTIKITSTHPIPKGRKEKKHRLRKSERQEAIGNLKVGESFALKTSVSSVSTLIWWAQAKWEGREFTSEAERPNVRIWRIK